MNTNQQLIFEKNKTKFIILSIIAAGIAIRVFFMPWNLPSLSPDAFVYLVEGLNYSKNNFDPIFNVLSRIVWPGFLSLFFSLFEFENYFGYLTLMRIISILISAITVPVVFLISRKYVDLKYSYLACIMFAFEPDIIENSLLSITEPIFILLGLISFYFTIYKEKYFIFSFVFAGLSFDTRLTGIVLIIFILLVSFKKIKTNKSKLKIIPLGIIIFLIISLPHFISSEEEIPGKELGGMTTFEKLSNILKTPFEKTGQVNLDFNNNQNISSVLSGIIVEEIIHLGRISIPFLIVFIPIGLVSLIRNFGFDRKSLIFMLFLIAVVSIPAYFGSVVFRHLLFVIPFFIIIAAIGISWILNKKKFENYVYVGIVGFLILSSLIFLDSRKVDEELILEQDLAAKYISNNLDGLVVGDNYTFNIQNIAELSNAPIDYEGNDKINIRYSPHPLITIKDLEEYAVQNKVSYFIIDSNKDNRYPIFEEIFNDEVKVDYLEVIFDSKEEGWEKYHFKIFKVNKLDISQNVVN